ncbi:MAG: PD40 domain-containing protein [Anaerolineales bacterium]|nr:PD40 domain-containing protein [Anaerolineales bacterium]
MAATFDANSTEYDDPQFHEAATHLHMGQWDKAIRVLEMLQGRYPGDARVGQMLQDARFKAQLEANTQIKEKRWIIPWNAILGRVGVIVTILVIVIVGVWMVRAQLMPMLANAQMQRQQMQLLNQAQAALAANDFDTAEQRFNALLALAPDYPGAADGLLEVGKQRQLSALYNEAVVADDAKRYELALSMYSELQIKAPGYRDVNNRLMKIRHLQDLDSLMEQARKLHLLGFDTDATSALMQIQSMDVNYRHDEVADLLYSLNLRQGKRILDQIPPKPDEAPQARDFFNAALKQKPNAPDAITEARLVVNFLRSRDAFDQQHWPEAVNLLRSIYNERPTYLGDATASMLFVAFIGAGDTYLNSGDLINAYEMYSQACQLALPDTSSACIKASTIIPLLTPTPTPTMTPTPGPTPPTATATPTATPLPLRMFRNRIVFKSDHPDLPGVYVIDPDGSNREYLGSFDQYEKAFDELHESERYSPDSQYRVSTADVDGRAQIILHVPYTTQFGQLPPKPVTRFSTAISYDPVWSPDGAWIAFVTTEHGTDDIWKSRPDSSEQVSLIRNEWEWDKHPSWSPDSKRIAFFSNREGVLQIFIMDEHGRYPTNISRVPWPEYDPIWVK